jgi:hypothetical protein
MIARTCAKLCHGSGGELEQIQFLLGHASVQTTERYLGYKQNLGHPVNDLSDFRTDGRPAGKRVRRCPGARPSRGDSANKEDGQPDPAVVVGSVGLGTLPDPTS